MEYIWTLKHCLEQKWDQRTVSKKSQGQNDKHTNKIVQTDKNSALW